MFFSLFKKKAVVYFSKAERATIVHAIKQAEQHTSGEIRVYVERKCSFVNAIDRAEELFAQLGMYNTQQRNAVLIYVAIKDRQVAIYGDKGIHEKVGSAFWNDEIKVMLQYFKNGNYAKGIEETALHIGDALHKHFPYERETDINELPDDIVFGD